MSNISPSGGGSSPPRLQRSTSIERMQIKGKRIAETSLEGEIEVEEKRQKISETQERTQMLLSLHKAMEAFKKIEKLPLEEKSSEDNKKVYNEARGTLLKSKTDPLYSSLIKSPEEINESSEKLLKTLVLYHTAPDYALKKIIAKQPLSKYIKLIQIAEEKNEKECDISKMGILTQIFPDSDEIYEKEKKAGKYKLLPLNYNMIEDIVKSSEEPDLLIFLLENANPDIRKTISSKDKFFEDVTVNDNFIKNFIEKHSDNPKILGRILENDTLLSSTQFDFLKEKIFDENREVFGDAKKNDSWFKDVITVAYNNIKRNPENISSKNLELLVEISASDVSVYQGNKDFLKKFINIAIELFNKHKKPELLISLIQRDDIKGNKFLGIIEEIILRPRLSQNETQHNELLSKFMLSNNKKIINILCKRERLSTNDDEHDERIMTLIDNNLDTDEILSESIRILNTLVMRKPLLINNENNNIYFGKLINFGKILANDYESLELLTSLTSCDRLSTIDAEHSERLSDLMNDGKDNQDIELLSVFARRNRLSLDDNEHNERLGDLIEIGQVLSQGEASTSTSVPTKGLNLLEILVKRNRLSTDDTQNAERFISLYNKYSNLRKIIASKENFQEIQNLYAQTYIQRYNIGGS